MRVHRGYLFWGIFFLLLGAIPLADQLGWIDVSSFGDAWRLWPLAIIAAGLAILLARTQAAFVGTVAAAAVIGLIAGGALAYGGGFIANVGDCGSSGGNLQHLAADGGFESDASVDLHLNCGTLDVTTGAGSGWSLDAGYRETAPTVEHGSDRLTVRAPDSPARRQEWNVTLPADALRVLDVQANAGTAKLDLGNATLDELRIEANAGEVRLATAGSIGDLQVSMNAGSAKLTIDGSAEGQLTVNAGSIDLCVPNDAALEFVVNEQFAFGNNLSGSGLARDGTTWRRAGDGPTISLRVEGNAASFNLNPSGGCR
ncbi:MAG: DUF5668 domain-containing protein [Chloroflexota bacterium]